jgi:hypothetical protein
MKLLTLDLDRELAALDHQTAAKVVHAMHVMLDLVKQRGGVGQRKSFSQRIEKHPAIGTWPSNLDVDAHIAQLRNEW